MFSPASPLNPDGTGGCASDPRSGRLRAAPAQALTAAPGGRSAPGTLRPCRVSVVRTRGGLPRSRGPAARRRRARTLPLRRRRRRTRALGQPCPRGRSEPSTGSVLQHRRGRPQRTGRSASVVAWQVTGEQPGPVAWPTLPTTPVARRTAPVDRAGPGPGQEAPAEVRARAQEPAGPGDPPGKGPLAMAEPCRRRSLEHASPLRRDAWQDADRSRGASRPGRKAGPPGSGPRPGGTPRRGRSRGSTPVTSSPTRPLGDLPRARGGTAAGQGAGVPGLGRGTRLAEDPGSGHEPRRGPSRGHASSAAGATRTRGLGRAQGARPGRDLAAGRAPGRPGAVRTGGVCRPRCRASRRSREPRSRCPGRSPGRGPGV